MDPLLPLNDGTPAHFGQVNILGLTLAMPDIYEAAEHKVMAEITVSGTHNKGCRPKKNMNT